MENGKKLKQWGCSRIRTASIRKGLCQNCGRDVDGSSGFSFQTEFAAVKVTLIFVLKMG